MLVGFMDFHGFFFMNFCHGLFHGTGKVGFPWNDAKYPQTHILETLSSASFGDLRQVMAISKRNMAVCQNLVPLVKIKIAGKWMFIPPKNGIYRY